MPDTHLQPAGAPTPVGTGPVAVIDIGSGNIGSILNMFRRCGVEVAVASRPEEVRAADRLVLPGVGAFDAVMSKLVSSGLIGALEERVLDDKVPLLGICVGLQLLARGSEEGIVPGLGWIPADVRRLPDEHRGERVRLPHMGWSRTIVKKSPQLLPALEQHDRFYFVHSYAMVCDRQEDVLATAACGDSFVAAVEVGNIAAVQFHPEKSHRHGLAVLRSFAATAAP